MKIALDAILATSKKNWKEQESEKTRGKKRYRERLAEEQEAEKLIKEFKQQEELGSIEDSEPEPKPEW